MCSLVADIEILLDDSDDEKEDENKKRKCCEWCSCRKIAHQVIDSGSSG